jgi:hypothetical protein
MAFLCTYKIGSMVNLLSSPRNRRRICWTAGWLAVVGGVAFGLTRLPAGSAPPERFEAASPQAVQPAVEAAPQPVRLGRRERAEIAELLARFVPAAVERRDPAAAYDLVTGELKTGLTRADWATGNIPVYPFRTKLERFDTWKLNYSFPKEVSLDVLLPAENRKDGAIAFTAVLQRSRGRWLVDSFFPAAAFSGAGAPPRIVAQPDLGPVPSTSPSAARLSAGWIFLPLGILGSIMLLPLVLFLRRR